MYVNSTGSIFPGRTEPCRGVASAQCQHTSPTFSDGPLVICLSKSRGAALGTGAANSRCPALGNEAAKQCVVLGSDTANLLFAV